MAPPHLHARHERALRAVLKLFPRVRTADVARELGLDYEQTAGLLADLDTAGRIRRDDLNHWVPTPTNATTPEKDLP